MLSNTALTSWLYSADELRAASPSRKDGVKMEQETLYREAGMQFIRQAGERLFTGAAKTAAPETSTKARTPHPCTFSAWLYFLRFYARRSFKKFERFEVAAACILLASKVEDTSKRVSEVLAVFHELTRGAGTPRPAEDSKEYWELKNKVVDRERFLLHTLEFEVAVTQPRTLIKPLVKSVGGTKTVGFQAFALMGDQMMMKSTLALQYPMELLARGAVLAAAMLTNFKFKEPLPESDSASHGGSSAASASWREILLSHEFPRAQMEDVVRQLCALAGVPVVNEDHEAYLRAHLDSSADSTKRRRVDA